jgi:hypothetical protein
MEIDLSKAPEGAEFYANNYFWKVNEFGNEVFYNGCYGWCVANNAFSARQLPDYEETPETHTAQQWPTDDRISAIAQNGGDGLHYDEQREAEEKKKAAREIEARERQISTKYDRIIVGKYGSGKCVVDVYRVLYAFPSGCPDIDHAIKKLLAPGKRGAKDELQDLREAIQSIEARIAYLNDTPA